MLAKRKRQEEMFKQKKESEKIPTYEQKRIFEILLERLADKSGRYDVEAVWVVSKLGHILNCEDTIIEPRNVPVEDDKTEE